MTCQAYILNKPLGVDEVEVDGFQLKFGSNPYFSEVCRLDNLCPFLGSNPMPLRVGLRIPSHLGLGLEFPTT